jgi:hypothetical protein
MIAGESTAVIDCSAREVLEWAADPERYRRADIKIARVLSTRRDGDSGRMRIIPRLRGWMGPPVELHFRLVRHRRLDTWIAPHSPVRLFASFTGTFLCEQEDGRTRVAHREVLSFRRPLRWIAEPLLRGWLARDTEAEVARLKALLAPMGERSDRAAPRETPLHTRDT